MKKYKYFSTDEFKEGENVWITGISWGNSRRRLSYKTSPVQCKIKSVTSGYITVDSKSLPWKAPSTYYLDTPDNSFYNNLELSLNLNVAKTREEAIENFNERIRLEIENKYEDFLEFRDRAEWFLL